MELRHSGDNLACFLHIHSHWFLACGESSRGVGSSSDNLNVGMTGYLDPSLSVILLEMLPMGYTRRLYLVLFDDEKIIRSLYKEAVQGSRKIIKTQATKRESENQKTNQFNAIRILKLWWR